MLFTLRSEAADRGSQFYSWKGISQFQELLGNLNVEHILTSPQSPQTIGKIESFHRNIQRELLRQKEFSTIQEAQKAIKKYVDYYNHERVHMVIDYLVPADRYSIYRICQAIFRNLTPKGLDV